MSPLKLLPKLREFEETLDISSPLSTSKAVLDISALRCTLKQDKSNNRHFRLSYATPGCSLACDPQTGDWKGKLHHELSGGVRLKLSQTVPQNKWFLVPSPRVKATTSLLGGRDQLYAKWDFLRRGGKVGERVYFSLDGVGDCKAHAEAASDGTLQYGLRAKAGRGLLHSAAVRYHSAHGAAFVLKSRPVDKARARATYVPGERRVQLQGQLWPAFLTSNLKITANYEMLLEGQGDASQPKGTVSLKWTY